MGRPAGGSMGRAASPMDGMAGPDGGLFDRGLPSVGRGGGNLLRGITLSGHDDPFLLIQFLTTELDTIQGGRS